MEYYNTPRFQYLLQEALRIKARERNYSDQQVISDALLVCKKSTLNRFRSASLDDKLNTERETVDQPIYRIGELYLNGPDAARLWRYLDDRGYVESVLSSNKGIRKIDLYPISTVANAVHCFYGVHASSISRFRESGISGNFFCYKPSFRKVGFTVKSLMTIEASNGYYFAVTEKQRTSGIYEMDKNTIEEISEGFGFIKTDRMWLFLRDIETEQPRIFCFNKPKFARSRRNERRSQISSMNGYLLEGAKGNQNDAFKFNAVLLAEDVDRDLWRRQFPVLEYDIDRQIDVYPDTKEQLERYKGLVDENPFLVPEEISEYLHPR